MEIGSTDIERARKIWLLGHSYPKAWVHVLNEPLDPRHPTRHNIWTSVLDRLQERVYSNGNHRRLDIGACHIANAAAKQAADNPPDWSWAGQSIPERIKQFRSKLANFQPPMLITFGADTYRFAQEALDFPTPSKFDLEAKGLGAQFRAAILHFHPQKVNVFPLLHAYVARGGWETAGKDYSGEATVNYFDYVGSQLGDILLRYGTNWPVWCE